MAMKLCEWCGQPAITGISLCKKCLQARIDLEQRDAEEELRKEEEELRKTERKLPRGEKKLNSEEKEQPKRLPAKREYMLFQATGRVFVLIGKSVAVVFLSAIMLMGVLMGLCYTLGALFSLSYPLATPMCLVFAGFALCAAYGALVLTRKIISSPQKQIQAQSTVPQIEQVSPLLIEQTKSGDESADSNERSQSTAQASAPRDEAQPIGDVPKSVPAGTEPQSGPPDTEISTDDGAPGDH
jgi:uncharacterized Zn finger protein (UPF0148 family)